MRYAASWQPSDLAPHCENPQLPAESEEVTEKWSAAQRTLTSLNPDILYLVQGQTSFSQTSVPFLTF